MAALWLRFRVEMRARWRAVLVLGVVAGLGAGAVLAALAGARRTDDAYERMLEATDAPDYVVRPGSGARLPFDRGDVAALPGVAHVAVVDYFYLTTQGPRETLVDRPSVLASGSASNGAYSAIGRPKVVLGSSAGATIPALALLALATIVVANLVSALPARTAARTAPALVLRAE